MSIESFGSLEGENKGSESLLELISWGVQERVDSIQSHENPIKMEIVSQKIPHEIHEKIEKLKMSFRVLSYEDTTAYAYFLEILNSPSGSPLQVNSFLSELLKNIRSNALKSQFPSDLQGIFRKIYDEYAGKNNFSLKNKTDENAIFHHLKLLFIDDNYDPEIFSRKIITRKDTIVSRSPEENVSLLLRHFDAFPFDKNNTMKDEFLRVLEKAQEWSEIEDLLVLFQRKNIGYRKPKNLTQLIVTIYGSYTKWKFLYKDVSMIEHVQRLFLSEFSLPENILNTEEVSKLEKPGEIIPWESLEKSPSCEELLAIELNSKNLHLFQETLSKLHTYEDMNVLINYLHRQINSTGQVKNLYLLQYIFMSLARLSEQMKQYKEVAKKDQLRHKLNTALNALRKSDLFLSKIPYNLTYFLAENCNIEKKVATSLLWSSTNHLDGRFKKRPKSPIKKK